MIDTRESITAKLCSFARAYHSNFERKKIFDDYLAYDIMGKEDYEHTVLANSSEDWPDDLTDNDKIAVIILNNELYNL